MKYSVVTICYNDVIGLEKTINSVINQINTDWEYIIVDGGSIDGSVDVIKRYGDYISKWISERDNGIADAFNKGIKMAKGEYVCLLNSGDEFIPGALGNVMEESIFDADVVHCNMILHRQDGTNSVKKPSLNYEKLLKKEMSLMHPGMFIKKSAYEKYGYYNTTYKCAMDRELVARMYSSGASFQYIDRELVIFKIGGESSVNFIKHAIPEDKLISLSHGASWIDVNSFAIFRKYRKLLSDLKWNTKAYIKNKRTYQ